ncbi:MAG: response regulator transcription factor [Desulfuromonadales bacterium]
MPIKIIIADDHEVVREGLKLILQTDKRISIVGEARNGREAIAQAEALLPDLLLMDISMSEMNGVEATRILHSSLPSIKVIILSMHITSEFILRAMQAGARAYVIKDSAGIEIHKAIRAVMNGRKFISAGAENQPIGLSVLSEKADHTQLSSLSRRERETLQLVVEGKSNAAIAELMNISVKSVETYRSRMMLKLGISNVPALVLFALRNGIITIQ